MSIKCNVCINKDSCKDCKVGWEDKFVPINTKEEIEFD